MIPAPSRPLAAATALALLAGCDTGSGSHNDHFEDSEHARAVVEDFAYEVVAPTYALLAERIEALNVAAVALQAAPDQSGLDAAQAAWAAARVPWEQSEGFLFGPVDARGIDPALDSWPVNRTDLDAVLASPDALDAAFLASLDPTLKGFHTAEYLLFGAEAEKTAADLTARELDYLVAVTAEMADLGAELSAAWSTGLDGDVAYADVVATAGEADNRAYPSMTSAAEEIVRGSIGILDEVANGKIADPFDQQDPDLVESQFSFNSLADFADNVRSVQNAWLGSVPEAGAEGTGLHTWVASVDADLDARVQAEIQAALDAIGRIPAPFRDAILDPQAADEIIAAQEALVVVKESMEGDVLPLLTH
ncbi:peptidase M75 [Myxococcota bacterium]|nr:peptidase M75 [Myxococcota bacterium]